MTLALVSEFSTPVSLMQELKGRTSEGQCGALVGGETFLYYLWQDRFAAVCEARLVGVNMWDCAVWRVYGVEGRDSAVFCLAVAMASKEPSGRWREVNPVEVMRGRGYQGFVTVDGCTLHVLRILARDCRLPSSVM